MSRQGPQMGLMAVNDNVNDRRDFVETNRALESDLFLNWHRRD